MWLTCSPAFQRNTCHNARTGDSSSSGQVRSQAPSDGLLLPFSLVMTPTKHCNLIMSKLVCHVLCSMADHTTTGSLSGPTHLPALLIVHADMPIELDGVADNQALNLPGVAKCQPVVRLLVLEAVQDALQDNKQTTEVFTVWYCTAYSQ